LARRRAERSGGGVTTQWSSHGMAEEVRRGGGVGARPARAGRMRPRGRTGMRMKRWGHAGRGGDHRIKRRERKFSQLKLGYS
jgi:hypothetical protein